MCLDTPWISAGSPVSATDGTSDVLDEPPVVLRFPRLSLRSWFRVAALRHARGTLPERGRRLARFLSYEQIDPTGRVVGGGGGMELAARYVEVHHLAKRSNAFWDDLLLLQSLGLAETVVRPAPKRKAVYALCARLDAIPNDLPEDLSRELALHQPPAPDVEPRLYKGSVRDAPASTFRLAGPAAVVRVTGPQAAKLAATPRWSGFPGLPAARAAAALLGDLAQLPALIASLSGRMSLLSETSPLHAKGPTYHPVFTYGEYGSATAKSMEEQKRTPQGAAKPPLESGGSAEARAVVRRIWAMWRRELGPTKVLLTSGSWKVVYDPDGENGQSAIWEPNPGAYDDLARLVDRALRRTTAGQVIDEAYGARTAQEPARALAARLWRIVHTRDDHRYRPAVQVPVAEHVRREDDRDPRLEAHAPPAVAVDTNSTRVDGGSGGAPAPHAREQLAQARRADRDRQDAARQARRDEHEAWMTRHGIIVPPLREHPNHHHRGQDPENDTATAANDSSPSARRTPQQNHAAALARARRERRQRDLTDRLTDHTAHDDTEPPDGRTGQRVDEQESDT